MNPSCRTDFDTLSIIFKHNRAEQALKFGALLNISATSVCTRGPSELFLIIIGLDLCSLGRRNIIYKSHIARVCREILMLLEIKRCIYAKYVYVEFLLDGKISKN